MNRWHFLLHHAANLLVLATGSVYFFMKYTMQPDDPYAVINHPWQPNMQHLHVLLGPLLVFMTGVLWSHLTAGLQIMGRGKRSGLVLAVSFAPMALSGYLLQIAGDEMWRTAWAWVHGVTSVLWTIGFLIHLARAVQRRRATGKAWAPPRRATSGRTP